MARLDRKAVIERAKGRCEYCLLPSSESVMPHEIDHIRARKHRGRTTLENTCLACAKCNGAKGSDATAYDPRTDRIVLLFNPRTDPWDAHFRWEGPLLRGRTAVGRATVGLLRINEPPRVEHRRLLMA